MHVDAVGKTPHLAGTRLGGRPLGVVARAAAASSAAGTVEERAIQVLAELRMIVPYRAAMLSAVDPLSGTTRELVREDYSDRISEYMEGAEFHDEVVRPFGFGRTGWPFRERDLPIDPLQLRVVAEYLRPDGYIEGLLSALVAPDGRYLGYLIMSVEDPRHPSDAACAVVGHIAPVLANLIDPLQSAAWLAATLLQEEIAVALFPDGSAVPLRGVVTAELLDPASPMRRAARELLENDAAMGAFLIADRDGHWCGCRVFSCRDGVAVVAVRPMGDLYQLTPRELEVLRHLVAGESNAEIAQALWVTPRTIRAHVERILDKLDVHNRSGAATKAVNEGLLLAP